MSHSKSSNFQQYLSLVKFSHTIFALPFAFIGYFLAVTQTDFSFTPKVFILVLLCMVFARTAAMSFNRVADRFIDKRNPRTADREIPAGKIQPRNALIFALANAVLFIVTTYFINRLVFYLSPIALLIILGYSYTKLYTFLCHFILGLGLSLAPTGAYLAVTGQFTWQPIFFSIIVILWVSGFDIVYAIQDEVFDKEEQLKSIPARFGKKASHMLAIVVHAISIIFIVRAGIYIQLGTLYWIGAALFVLLLALQHIVANIDYEKRVNFAFATVNGMASIIYAIFTILSFYFH